jgi:hypothetical protein
MTGVPALLNKIQLIIDKLRYRQHELEDEFYRSNNDSNRSLIEAINTMWKRLIFLPFTD